MPIHIYIMGVLIAIVIGMFFPEDIKSYPVAKKWIIGIITGTILFIVIFAFFILSAFLLG